MVTLSCAAKRLLATSVSAAVPLVTVCHASALDVHLPINEQYRGQVKYNNFATIIALCQLVLTVFVNYSFNDGNKTKLEDSFYTTNFIELEFLAQCNKHYKGKDLPSKKICSSIFLLRE